LYVVYIFVNILLNTHSVYVKSAEYNLKVSH
jgi:hypothetical protein